ncbi:MAG: ribose-phosphate pyrophosphokinase [Gammaproteobacteria bacterium]|nr:MAG: ribose-phosphate pyrophosphokinase [Gammaproteobacteria bacterium]
MQQTDAILFTGNANKKLSYDIATYLQTKLGDASVETFSDGEISVEILDNVRGRDVFIIQPTSSPANENIMELMIMVDALSRASAARITAVVPYFGYSRQDRRVRSQRVAITSKLIANMFAISKVDRLLTVDLHAEQIQGFFDIPVDNIYASPILLGDIYKKQNTDNLVVVSPDVGGVVRARAIAKQLGDLDLAIIDKRRPAPNQSQVMNIIGEVNNKTCILVDDIVDTAGTICKAADALKEHKANKVVSYATHPVLSGNALENIKNSQIDELVVTDTISLAEEAKKCKKIRQITIANLLGEAISRIHNNESVSSLYS